MSWLFRVPAQETGDPPAAMVEVSRVLQAGRETRASVTGPGHCRDVEVLAECDGGLNVLGARWVDTSVQEDCFSLRNEMVASMNMSWLVLERFQSGRPSSWAPQLQGCISEANVTVRCFSLNSTCGTLNDTNFCPTSTPLTGKVEHDTLLANEEVSIEATIAGIFCGIGAFLALYVVWLASEWWQRHDGWPKTALSGYRRTD